MRRLLVPLMFSLLIMCQTGYWNSVQAAVNPEVDEDGITAEVCDVRNDHDSGTDSLRHRLELFNAEIGTSNSPTGEGQCLFGIYFLDPMTITLRSALQIRAIQSLLRDGQNYAGTYISGRRENGQPLPVYINAVEVNQAGKCAVQIEGGLNTFQQIHDVTIVVTDMTKAICDAQGRDLMELPVPAGSARQCSAGTLAKNCDFKDVTVRVDTTVLDQDGDGHVDSEDNCPAVSNNTQEDLDKDGSGDACDEDDDGDLILDLDDACPLVSDNNGSNLNQDADHDGLADRCEDEHLNDYDNDGLTDQQDFCDAVSDNGSNDNQSVPTVDDPQLSEVDALLERLRAFVEAQRLQVARSVNQDLNLTVDCQTLSETNDQDQDGLGDACDDDVDGDGVVNTEDPYICTLDGDGDGVSDAEDECPTKRDFQVAPCQSSAGDNDNDSDGLPDNIFPDDSTDNSTNQDQTSNDSDGGGGCSLGRVGRVLPWGCIVIILIATLLFNNFLLRRAANSSMDALLCITESKQNSSTKLIYLVLSVILRRRTDHG